MQIKSSINATSLIFFLVGLLCTGICVFQLFQLHNEIKTHTVRSKGTVSDVTQHVDHDDDGDTYYYEYTVHYETEDGAQRSFHVRHDSKKRKDGQSIEIYCTPDWSDAIINDFSSRRLGSIMGVFMGLIFAAAGVFLHIRIAKQIEE